MPPSDRSDRPRRFDKPGDAHKAKPPNDLPRWLVEELTATTAPARLDKAFDLAAVVMHGAEDPDVVRAAALALRDAAPRSPTAREMAGLASYAAGRFGDARADLMTFKRLNGSTKHDVLIADCYRGEGRPERAVELLEGSEPNEVKTRLQTAVIRAAAHADMGNQNAAAATLRLAGIARADLPAPGSIKRAIKPSGPPPRKKLR